MITEKGSLVIGVTVGDVTHKDFVMRQSTIGDVISAVELAGPDSSNLRVRIYKAALAMESLGTLDREAITGELLLGLPEDDLEPILDAQDAIEKKLLGLRNASSPTESSK